MKKLIALALLLCASQAPIHASIGSKAKWTAKKVAKIALHIGQTGAGTWSIRKDCKYLKKINRNIKNNWPYHIGIDSFEVFAVNTAGLWCLWEATKGLYKELGIKYLVDKARNKDESIKVKS